MQNIAYYLKYRPQTLDEVIGQENIKKTLFSAFENDKLSHAYLFVGPRGTGKTSTARVLAKMVNCELVQSPENTTDLPCNKCSNCISITDGSNMDLIEIDAASNRGIEDIRSLRDKIKLAPTNAKKKVYIIDEVHMLTTEAFNALLKTLEEPPRHALFILATTDVAKVPQTIMSRVQRLDFKLAKSDEITRALVRIIKEEKIEIEEEALKILAEKADGSFRDGVKFLDQVSSTGKITVKSLEENLKLLQFDFILDLLKNFSEQSLTKSLLTLSKQTEIGVDIKELIISLMDNLRMLVFIKNGLGEELVKPKFSEGKYVQLVRLAESFTNQQLLSNLNILQNSLESLKFASISLLPLELAIAQICNSCSVIASPAPCGAGAEQSPDYARDGSPQSVEDRSPREAGHVPFDYAQGYRDDSQVSSEVIQDDKATVPDSPDILKLKEKWTFVLETIRPFNFSLEALLRSISVSECTESAVIMEVPYAFHQRILEAPKNRDLLEGVFSDVLGRRVRISTVLGSRPQKREDVANIEVASDDEIIRAAAEIFNSDTVN